MRLHNMSLLIAGLQATLSGCRVPLSITGLGSCSHNAKLCAQITNPFQEHVIGSQEIADEIQSFTYKVVVCCIHVNVRSGFSNLAEKSEPVHRKLVESGGVILRV